MCDAMIADPNTRYAEMNRAASPGGTVEASYFSAVSGSTSRRSRSLGHFAPAM
jgi:hypothetical protein